MTGVIYFFCLCLLTDIRHAQLLLVLVPSSRLVVLFKKEVRVLGLRPVGLVGIGGANVLLVLMQKRALIRHVVCEELVGCEQDLFKVSFAFLRLSKLLHE
jgi:hypothetical protein